MTYEGKGKNELNSTPRSCQALYYSFNLRHPPPNLHNNEIIVNQSILPNIYIYPTPRYLKYSTIQSEPLYSITGLHRLTI